jgi:hypothetical protein
LLPDRALSPSRPAFSAKEGAISAGASSLNQSKNTSVVVWVMFGGKYLPTAVQMEALDLVVG